MNTKNCFKHMAALLAMLLVGLCAAPRARAQSADGGNIYVRVFSFDSEIKEITNGLVLLNSSNIETFFNSLENRYTLSTKPGTLLYRAVQTGLSVLKADEMRLPEDIVAVNLITFTDGIDQGSTTPGLAPVPGYLSGDSLARMTPEESRDYIKRQLNTLQVRGKPITGYSIGLMGTDVDPANQHLFSDNLNAFNSEEKNFDERQSIDQIRENFREIGGRLFEQTRESIMMLDIPAPNPGTRVRWTFDIERGNNSSAVAAGSRRYLEGDFDYDANDYPLLKNIRYGGDIQSAQYYPGSTVTGKLNGMMVQFEFSQFSGANDTDIVREWLQISGSNSWQANVEFVKNATEIRQEIHRSTVIYMVLDSSMSMGRENIERIKDSVAAALEPFDIRRGTPPRERVSQPERVRAPSNNLPNYVFVDFAPLLAGVLSGGFGIGFGYERAFVDPFSIAFYFDIMGVSGSSSLFAWDILIRPRWYPLKSAVGKWYLGAILGYGMLIEEDYYSSTTSAFTVGLETGYKFVFGHFGLEPWIGYTLGSYGGFKFGATLGFVW
ncbi:MAG: hypothetical protein LBK73_09590 [Treponema sp.]|nr:hypothetical protein [Treponema sp.]